MSEVDIVIVGGGPAGMSAALSAYDAGARNILIFERDENLGGILRQCIHNGFGIHKFKEELTGPEYAYRYEEQVRARDISFKTNTMVLDIAPDKTVTAISAADGCFSVKAKAIILAMGCRERPIGALKIPGTRPAGIFSAGTAQKFVNIEGYLPGKNVVILGSGDIGLIMARRMTLEGAKVKAVCELLPYSGGLARNIEQCLNDFGIPLMLGHTVVEIHGRERLTGVSIAKVDEKRRPIPESKQFIECDTLLLSVGLIPENELTKGARINLDRVTGGAVVDQSRQTESEGIFACGNVLHVHDLVDYVSEEAEIAGRAAADFIAGKPSDRSKQRNTIKITVDGKIRYTVPQKITSDSDVTVYFRVSDVFADARISVKSGDRVLYSKKKTKLTPGEMEAVTLSSEVIKSISGDTISFGIQ